MVYTGPDISTQWLYMILSSHWFVNMHNDVLLQLRDWWRGTEAHLYSSSAHTTDKGGHVYEEPQVVEACAVQSYRGEISSHMAAMHLADQAACRLVVYICISLSSVTKTSKELIMRGKAGSQYDATLTQHDAGLEIDPIPA